MKIYAALGDGFAPLAHEKMNALANQYCKNRLFSYYYHGAMSNNRPSYFSEESSQDKTNSLFLDSGAFSAYSQGKHIDIDKYAEFIHATDGWWEIIANLDIIGGTEQENWDNLEALESNGCNVAPVFHAGEDPKWLSRMLDKYEYILLGGLVTTGGRRAVIRDLDRIFETHLTDENQQVRVKLHGFGLTQLDLVFRYPWYSVDSSSWVLTAAFGSCIFYWNKKLQQVVFSKESPSLKDVKGWHFDRMSEIEQQAVIELLEPTQVTQEEVREGYPGRRVVNLYAFQQIEKEFTKFDFHPDYMTLGLF